MSKPALDVKELDPQLEYIQTFPGSVIVYQVMREGRMHILKAAPKEQICFLVPLYEEVVRECSALERAGPIEGVSRLVQKYETPDYFAILKEYIEGERLDRLSIKPQRRVKEELVKTVKRLHRTDIFDLDLMPRNIIVAPNLESLTLIDFTTALSSNCSSLCQKLKSKLRDYQDLKNLSKYFDSN